MLRCVLCVSAIAVGMALVTPAAADDVYIAGVSPHQRPASAPVMRVSDRDRSPVRQFRGVAKPYPLSLRFAKYHGGWFTPFTEPGMTGRYDLRAHHQPPVRAQMGAKPGD